MEKSLTFVIQKYYRNLQLLEIDVDPLAVAHTGAAWRTERCA